MSENEEDEIQEPPPVESETATDAGAAPIPTKDPFRPIPLHLETALRMTATCFVGYSLSYAGTLGYVDSIPPSLAWLIGLLSAACATRLPVVAAVPLVAIVPGTTVVLFSLAVSTALLCAATVSDGLFVACSALFSLWVGGLRFGKMGKATQILAPLVVVIFGMVALGLQRLVRDGITISISSDLLGAMLGTDLEAIPEEQLLTSLSLVDLGALDSATLLARMSPFAQHFESRLEEGLATLREMIGVIEAVIQLIVKIVRDGFACFDFPIPDTFFSDQTVCVTFTEERDLIIHIEGGVWLIRRLWTTTGIDNPFALFPNFLVAMSWAAVALCTGILIPPLRTVRYSLTGIALPNTLRDASWFLQRRLGEDQETMTEEEKVVGRRLIKAVSKFHGGTIAVATAFEPRLLDFRFNLPRCTWWKLIAVTKAVETAAMTALVSSVMYSRHASTDILSVCTTYEKSAEALQDKSSSEKIATVEEVSAPMKPEDDQLGIEQSGRTLAESVDSWNEAMHPTSTVSWSEAGKEAALVSAIFMGPTLLILARLIQILFYPILAVAGRGKWNLYKVAHVVKFAIGFTAIVCLSLYSDYHDLEVTIKDDENAGFEILNGTPISSFVAWDLMAYAFATMPTTEGTVKKCAFRVAGTLMGAFSAFLLLRATGDNMYGSVAWLTVTAFPAIYIMIEDNDSAATMGPSKIFGYGGFYFVLTQSAIVMEYLAGAGEGDDLVVNRLLSNLLGIAMACFLAVVPPKVMGGDPKWTELILQETKSATEKFILGLLDDDEAALVHLQKSHSEEFDALKVDATYLFEDAKRGSIFPFYRVDERLEEEIDQLVITSAFLRFLMTRAIEAMKAEDVLFIRDSQLSFDLSNVLRSIRKPPEKENLKEELVVLSGDPGRDLINELGLLARRITQHESTLRSIMDGNARVSDPEDAPVKVEHALRESISESLTDRDVLVKPQNSASENVE